MLKPAVPSQIRVVTFKINDRDVSAREDETILQVVVRGGSGSYRLPLGLSYDPSRLWVAELVPAPGVELLRDEVRPDEGWIELELVVVGGIESGQAVAALKVQALEAGPAPLVFTAASAINADGVVLPVAASDGALFVNPFDRPEESP